jgi:hypothetical protein
MTPIVSLTAVAARALASGGTLAPWMKSVMVATPPLTSRLMFNAPAFGDCTQMMRCREF